MAASIEFVRTRSSAQCVYSNEEIYKILKLAPRSMPSFVLTKAEQRVAQLRAFVGPQLLLDVLRVHVCTSRPTRSPKRSSCAKPNAAAASATAASTLNATYAADGAVICRPVSPINKAAAGSGGECNDAKETTTTTTTMKEPLERCIGACMRMLQAMLSSELSPTDLASASLASFSPSPDPTAAATSTGVETSGQNHRDSSSTGAEVLSGEVFNQMPFLEGGFGDGLEMGGGGAGDARDVEEGDGQGGGAVGGGGIDAAVVCLQECQSPDVQRGLLAVLLGLRDERPTPLRRELLR